MPEVNTRIRNALWKVLDGVADEIDVDAANGRQGAFKARIKVGRAVHVATVLWAGEGWPEDVTRALSRMTRFKPISTVLAAHHLSPGAIERIERLGLGWVDETGSARVVLQSGLAVRTDGQGRRISMPPETAFSWTRSAIAVAEAALTTQDVNVRDLNLTTGVSLGRISRILQSFDDMGFTTKVSPAPHGGYIRQLRDRDALLKAWVPAAGTQVMTRWLMTRATREPLRYLETSVAPILSSLGKWALTGPAAAEVVAPFLTSVPVVHIYVPANFQRELTTLQHHAGLTPVGEGHRFELRESSEVTLRLSRSAVSNGQTLAVADYPRIYADLLSMGGRYEEAAGHLREVTNLGW